ncbi:MAG: 4-hydroxy-tetrahydrodipicolinate reductase [Alphaproteobacteria bacterium]|nr:4-hydroxy-tetrahydrodipicolinate reductase [Rickettsiales bacterium]
MVGASGKMGNFILKEIISDSSLVVGGCFCSDNSAVKGLVVGSMLGLDIHLDTCFSNDLLDALNADCIIDFSHFSITTKLVNLCLEKKYSGILLVGTTALSSKTYQKLEDLSKTARVAVLSNTTTGIIAMHSLVKNALAAVPNAEVEIVEKHHSLKDDAPSGTALSLAETVAKQKGLNINDALQYGRVGKGTKRSHSEIGMFSMRGGLCSGEHSIQMFFGSEVLEIKHTASNKSCFAKGAVDIVKKMLPLKGSCLFTDDNINKLLLK